MKLIGSTALAIMLALVSGCGADGTATSGAPSGKSSAQSTAKPTASARPLGGSASAAPSAAPPASAASASSSAAPAAASTEVTRYKLKLPAGWKVAGEDKADALVQLDSAPVADGEAGGVMMIAPSDNAIWKDHNDPKDATDLVEKAGKSPWILGTLPIVVMDSTGELPDGFFEKGHNIVDKKEPRVLIAVRKKPSAKSLYCVAMQLPDDATRDAALEICKSAQF